MTYKENLEEYVDEFTIHMKERFEEKRKKYRDTWKYLPVNDTAEYQHQNKRFKRWFDKKFAQWEQDCTPINWIDVACEALICYVREHEEMVRKIME